MFLTCARFRRPSIRRACGSWLTCDAPPAILPRVAQSRDEKAAVLNFRLAALAPPSLVRGTLKLAILVTLAVVLFRMFAG
jgi:hypothetical protein